MYGTDKCSTILIKEKNRLNEPILINLLLNYPGVLHELVCEACLLPHGRSSKLNH